MVNFSTRRLEGTEAKYVVSELGEYAGRLGRARLNREAPLPLFCGGSEVEEGRRYLVVPAGEEE
jgi:hypothetical protein